MIAAGNGRRGSGAKRRAGSQRRMAMRERREDDEDARKPAWRRAIQRQLEKSQVIRALVARLRARRRA